MAYPLSPEEEVMSSVGATSVAPSSRFDLTGALQAGVPLSEIADFLAGVKHYNVQAARQAGITDEQIVSELTGNTGFSAGVKRFVESAGSSIKGLAQMAGLADTERLRAERQAAEIASANNPYIGGAAEFAGAIADPVNLPALAVAPLRGATLAATMAKQGAAQGAFGGLLEPVLKEGADTGLFSTERAKGAALGTVGGAVLGGVLGKGAESLVNYLTKKADVPLADVPAGKAATDTAISDVAKLVDEPVTNERVFRDERYDYKPLSLDEKTLIDQRIALLEGDINKLSTERVKVDTTETAEKQVASLLRGEEKAPVQEATGLPATNRGLVSPTRATPEKQTPALFKAAEKPPEAPAKGVTPISEAPQVAALFKGYSLDADIKAKQAEIEQLRSVLAKDQEVKMLQVTKQLPQPLTQVETKTAARFNEQPVLTKQGEVPPAALTAPPPRAATIATQQVTPEVQAVLERNGFKTMEEANAALGKQPLTYEEATRMPSSGGAAATRPESMFADASVFSNVEEATRRMAAGEKPPRINRAEIEKIPELESLMKQTVSFFGKELKLMREGGKFSGTLKGTTEAGDALIRKAQKEEGSIFAYFFKQDEAGNFVNIDKTWNRADVAAYAPVVKYAEEVYNKVMADAVALRRAGQLTDDALNDIAYKLQFPTQVMAILQGKRTEASRTLNAFKTLKGNWDNKKTVDGLMPNSPC
jgi:uncharacterized small protein (DUF1192 family)